MRFKPGLTGRLFLYPAFLFLGALLRPAGAQKGEVAVNVQFRVIEMGISNLEKRVDPVFKFYLGKEDGLLLNGTGMCYKFSSKSSTNSFILPDPKYPGWEYLKPFSVPILSRSSLTLTMECYSDDKGETCSYDKKDDFHSITTKTIDLLAFTPGDYSDTFRITDKDSHFWSKVEFRYSLAAPGPIKAATALQAVNAADKPVVLQSSYVLPNREKLKFIWEFSDDKGSSWSRLQVPKDDPFSVTVHPLKDLFGGKLKTTEEVMFRFRVNSRDTFAISDTLKTAFTAVPPNFSKEQVKITPTCRGYENGALAIGNIEFVRDKVLYVLRKASEGKQPCPLAGPSAATCAGMVRSGEAASGSIELKGLPADAYTLMLYNPEVQVGNVFTAYDFAIQPFQPLAVARAAQRNPNCLDDNGGQIMMSVTGGSSREAWQIGIAPNVSKLELTQNEISFKNLPEGNYTLDVIDGCGEQISKTFALKKPEKLQIEKITVRRSPEQALIINLRNGSGRYKAIISDRNQYVKVIDSLINNIVPIADKGIFRIQIFDKADPDCLSVDTTYSVAETLSPMKGVSRNDAGLRDKGRNLPAKGMFVFLFFFIPRRRAQNRIKF